MKTRLYEVSSNDTWWVASQDELGIVSLVQYEMYDRGYTDREVDDALSDIEIRQIYKTEAETIGIQLPNGETRSVWDCYLNNRREGVIGSSLDQETIEISELEELDFDLE